MGGSAPGQLHPAGGALVGEEEKSAAQVLPPAVELLHGVALVGGVGKSPEVEGEWAHSVAPLRGCRGLSPVPGAGLEHTDRRGSGVDRIAS